MSRPRSSGLSKRILLYIFALAMIITAVVIVLQGFGVLTTLPGFVIGALVMITIGVGILGGLRSRR